ncbi:MAG: TIGR02281 family clan AA aspartic protease [Hyphomicrobiales bacterium]
MTLFSSVSMVGYLENWAERPEFRAARVAAVRFLGVGTAEEPKARVAAAAGRTVTLQADESGHFTASGTVNGRHLRMLVDTGATNVVLTGEDAQRLGIRLRAEDYVVPISTANGRIGAAAVLLDEVRIGSIAVKTVPALVLQPGLMDGSLLGMSFFSRLRSVEMRGRDLVLKN